MAWAPAGCIVFPRVMKLINTVLSFLSTLLFLLFLLFRRRLKSVADVLKSIRDRGFTQSR